MQKYMTQIKIVILAVMLSLGVGFVFAQWSGPTDSFPDGNTDRPLNVGSTLQTKTGSLWANFLGSDTGLYAQGNAEIGGTITIAGGSPADGKVLMAQDSDGLASWSVPSLDCRVVTSSTTGSSGSVSCGATETATGGGGSCGSASLTSSRPLDPQEGWQIQCSASDSITSYAICCESQLQSGGSAGSSI